MGHYRQPWLFGASKRADVLILEILAPHTIIVASGEEAQW